MNSPKTLSRIYIKDKAAHQYYGHHITVVREASRINIENEVATIKADSLIFNGYKDGLIGELISTNVLTTINSESVDTQFNWIKIDDQSNGIYSIHGAFMPNDTEAIGQQQVSKVSFV